MSLGAYEMVSEEEGVAEFYHSVTVPIQFA